MKLLFTEQGWEDYTALRSGDQNAHKKLDSLLQECLRHPFFGTGKPEPLKENFKGWWSRRISREHRLVYRVVNAGEFQSLEVAQCIGHY